MWAAVLYVVGGAIVAFGVRVFWVGTGQRNGRLSCALLPAAAGVLWPVLLLGVIQAVVIAGAIRCARFAHSQVCRVENAWLDEGLAGDVPTHLTPAGHP